MSKVYGTQNKQPDTVEFGEDTVYVRANIVRGVDADNKERWEYEEVQYSYPEYVKLQQRQIDNVMLAQVELAAIVGGGNNG